MGAIRKQRAFNLIEWIMSRAFFKKFLAAILPRDGFTKLAPKYGLIIHVNEKGKIDRSLHDTSGSVIDKVSQVLEFGDHLYLGSFGAPFLGRLNVKDL